MASAAVPQPTAIPATASPAPSAQAPILPGSSRESGCPATWARNAILKSVFESCGWTPSATCSLSGARFQARRTALSPSQSREGGVAMIEAPHYAVDGAKRSANFALPAEYFDGTVNEPVLHQAVKVYLNNQRQGTHMTKS